MTEEKTTILESVSLNELLKVLETQYHTFKSENLIINLSAYNAIDDIERFMSFSIKHKATKKSFVIVNNSVNIDDVSDDITVVPTLQEAHDIIEMEVMERDLGL